MASDQMASIDPAEWERRRAMAAVTTLSFLRFTYTAGDQLWKAPPREVLPEARERDPDVLWRRVTRLQMELTHAELRLAANGVQKVMADPNTTAASLVIRLDRDMAKLVSGACIVAAELDDTANSDARVLKRASAIIMGAVVAEAESNG